MYSIIYVPNLPNTKVKSLLIGSDYVNLIEDALQTFGIEVIKLPINTAVSLYLRSHADLMAVHIGGEKLVLARELGKNNIVNILTSRGLHVIFSKTSLGEAYPADIGLCAAFASTRVFHNLNYIDSAVTENIDSGILFTHINQGYAKCSICVVDENSIITSDYGVRVAAAGFGLDVLFIENLEIELPGYDNGFIGGASFKIARDKMAFTGHFKSEAIRERLETFLSERGISAVYLTTLPIFDIGGAIPLFEVNE